jgi:hypothetical protein
MAGILGRDDAGRAAIFREMKAYYELRSKLVHGAALKEKHHALLADTERLRHLVRDPLRGFVHLATTPRHACDKAWFQEHLDVALQVESERIGLRDALNLQGHPKLQEPPRPTIGPSGKRCTAPQCRRSRRAWHRAVLADRLPH